MCTELVAFGYVPGDKKSNILQLVYENNENCAWRNCIYYDFVFNQSSCASIRIMLKLMNKKIFSILIAPIWVLSLLVCADAGAGQQDDFLKAREAYEKEDITTLANLSENLTKKDYLLAPYTEYWWMSLYLDEVTSEQVATFLSKNQEYPFADKLRGEWLKILGIRQNWKSFLAMYPQYESNDPAVSCYYAEADADANGPQKLNKYKALWLQEKDQPESCDSLFDKMQQTGVIKEDDIKQRFRMVLKKNRVSLAKSLIKRSANAKANILKELDLAYKNPSLAISKRQINANNSYGKETYLFALDKLTKKDSNQALSAYSSIKSLLDTEERSYFYGRLALQAAKRHEPEAYGWFQIAVKNSQLDEEQFEWFTRAALRAVDWNGVINVTELMPEVQANQATWRYWRARALKAQGRVVEANALFAPLATERHYYGWLAQDELGDMLNTQAQNYVPTNQDVDEIAKLPGIKRAIALEALEMSAESKAEWAQAIKNMDDKKLLSAAEFAARKKWFDISVNTADKTTQIHNFDLRYPRPYQQLTKPAAKEKNIDEAWVYGIIRQESRFMHEAKSRTGAAGLMQLMPATAKWIAKKVGLSRYSNQNIHDIDVNIDLGTHYMKYVLDQFNGQETMTTAAYNAGPSRAKKWMAATPLDGTIYTETIPFDETRNYVKRVMANAHIYGHRLGLQEESLKDRMGVIPAKEVSIQ
jgi:soluble lytic murein transglycosylase